MIVMFVTLCFIFSKTWAFNVDERGYKTYKGPSKSMFGVSGVLIEDKDSEIW